MTILIRKALIQDPSSTFHQSTKDILIINGTISRIEEVINETADQVIESAGISISPGWVDIFSHFCDPGYEHKESLETGAMAAAAGGFTHVFLVPNTSPAVHSKSQVEYIVEKSRNLPACLHPIGAITKNAEGKELAEMYDMKLYDAVAFSDGLNAVQSAGLLIKALQYVKAINGVIIQLPDDRSIAPGGLINEGIVSTRLGLPGKPAMAEEIMVARDIKLARYTESRLHITGITSAKSLEYIKRAKDGNIQVTCSVTPYHMFFTDEDLVTYDTNLKVNLPLRTRRDAEALRNGVLDGTVDCVTTHHQPQEWDSKTCEFENAKHGMIGLESCYGVLGALDIPEKKIHEVLSTNPRRIFGLPESSIQIGNKADFTIYQAGVTFTYGLQHIRSKSKNSAFTGKTLSGKVIGTVSRDKLYLNP